MKKSLSVLLALCLVVVLAVPAFAADFFHYNGYIGVAFNNNNAAKVSWDRTTYTAKNGEKIDDIRKMVVVQDALGQVLDVSGVSFYPSGQLAPMLKADFSLEFVNTSTVDIVGTIKAVANNGVEATATFTIKAGTISSTTTTTSFTVKATDIIKGAAAETVALTILPDDGKYFTVAQAAAFQVWAGANYQTAIGSTSGATAIAGNPGLISRTNMIVTTVIPAGLAPAYDNLQISIPNNSAATGLISKIEITALASAVKTFNFEIRNDYFQNTIRYASINSVDPINTTAALLSSSVLNVAAGSTVKIPDILRSPSNANDKISSVKWYLETRGGQTAIQAAQVAKLVYTYNAGVKDGLSAHGIEVRGINPGTVLLRCDVIYTGGAEFSLAKGNALYATVTVGQGELPVQDAKLSPTSASIAVNGTQWLDLVGVQGVITYTSSDESIATVVGGVEGAKVFGKKAGTVTITAKRGSEVIGTASITVTAASTGTSTNPQTGDGFFANLF